MTEAKLSSNHPPLPPTSEDDRVFWLRLLRSRRVGVGTFFRLMREHGTAQAALENLPQIAKNAGVNGYAACPEPVALKEMRQAAGIGARMICFGDTHYPADLAEISDAPPILWVRGTVEILSKPMIALIGARNASSLGLRMARGLARDLSKEGLVTVSGLARGIDTAAHQASLENGTVAVLGGGVDVIYPAENTKLAEDILRCGGALISEQPMGMQPMARHFPARNRIVSGLSKTVVVVEAAAKSGTLITARSALDQGREVMAVPGHPFDARAGGCNMLIRDGAWLVRSGGDVIEALPSFIDTPGLVEGLEAQGDYIDPPLETPQSNQPDLPSAAPQVSRLREVPAPQKKKTVEQETVDLHQDILNRLGPSPLQEDQLIRDLGAPTVRVNPALTDLELDGRIRRQPGGYLSLVTK